MEEYILTPRTNILWNAILTVIAITGLTELLLILPWDIPELHGFAFMDIIDLARANFTILDVQTRRVDFVTILLLIFWALAGLAAGARSRRLVHGAISGLLGAIFVVLMVAGGVSLGGVSITTALPPAIGIVLGLGTATVLGGIGGRITSSPTKSRLEERDRKRKIWTKDEKWVCPSCGAAIPPGAFVCPACGADVIE